MKSISMFILAVFVGSSCQQDVFSELAQLCGNWKLQSSRGVMYEYWEKVDNNELHGKSYKLNGNDTVTFENTRLAKLSDGFYYMPIVSNQNNGKAVPFKMIKSDNQTFVFENKEHDFPQRIIYHIVSKDSVHAWIEGTKNGKEGREDYYFTRLK